MNPVLRSQHVSFGVMRDQAGQSLREADGAQELGAVERVEPRAHDARRVPDVVQGRGRHEQGRLPGVEEDRQPRTHGPGSAHVRQTRPLVAEELARDRLRLCPAWHRGTAHRVHALDRHGLIVAYGSPSGQDPGAPTASVMMVTSDEETRRRIIDAAAELFAQHGYEGVGVRQVAQAAGVSQYAVRKRHGRAARALRLGHDREGHLGRR